MNGVQDPQYVPKAILRARRKPLMIWAAPALLVFWSLSTIGYGAMLFMSRGTGRIAVGGVEFVGAGQHVLMAAISVAVGLGVAVAAYGFLVERLWARPLLVSWTAGASASMIAITVLAGGDVATALALGLRPLVILAIMAWYLYGSRRVVAYYGDLVRKGAQGGCGGGGAACGARVEGLSYPSSNIRGGFEASGAQPVMWRGERRVI